MSAQPLIDRHYLDQHARRALPRVALRKRLGSAFGVVARSTPSRWYSGAMPSPITHVLRTLHTLATADGCSPWPVISEGLAIVTQAEIRAAATVYLETRRAELMALQPILDANAQRGGWEAARMTPKELHAHRIDHRDARMRCIEGQLELAAIEAELWEREERCRA